jgi:hypothetical protein
MKVIDLNKVSIGVTAGSIISIFVGVWIVVGYFKTMENNFILYAANEDTQTASILALSNEHKRMVNDYVSKELFNERNESINERFARNERDIQELRRRHQQ